ncbi:hypothetical protein TNIN_389341 [Trichonephila inaurata madagascariensis]|uniref:Uncharacterized protein n=1 Tax=Trichonephila inaurata madagascariensis TaxID=2747483 RepID=A0A8X6I9Z2_9ARAC|nr:hypothetical protein TNIN_389341 [Trichonephila inaurata madagascariensis]
MTAIGKGFSAGKKLFSLQNILSPSKCAYIQQGIKLLHAASQAANSSMLESVKLIAECSNECGVSVDGTWQLNGCFSAISVDSGKILRGTWVMVRDKSVATLYQMDVSEISVESEKILDIEVLS